MSRHPSPASSPESPAGSSPGSSRSPSQDVFDLYLREDDEDRRSLRISLVVAALVHAALLWVTLPALSGPEIPEPEEQKVFVVAPPPRYQKPPPPTPERPQAVREVPMPDDTPDDPEPIVFEEPAPVEPPEIPDPILPIPDAPPPPPEPQGPIQVGGEIERPERVHYVEPVYPEMARRVRKAGPVILQAVIAKDGSVKDLKVLRGLPFQLTEAALDAVRQWRYTPTALNGKPVEVKMTVTVIFELS